MLEYTKAGDGARLAMLVLHDDAKREYAYGPATGAARDEGRRRSPQALYDEAKKQGWTVVSMKDDWKRIFCVRPIARYLHKDSLRCARNLHERSDLTHCMFALATCFASPFAHAQVFSWDPLKDVQEALPEGVPNEGKILQARLQVREMSEDALATLYEIGVWSAPCDRAGRGLRRVQHLPPQALFAGGTTGKRVVVNSRTQRQTFMKMVRCREGWDAERVLRHLNCASSAWRNPFGQRGSVRRASMRIDGG